MSLFRVYFSPEVSGNEPLDVDLGLTSDAIGVVKGPVIERRRSELGNPHGFGVYEVVSLHNVPDCNVRVGDVVWRDWDQFEHALYSAADLEVQMKSYKPIWEPGPGWLELRQDMWGDVDLRRND